MSFKAQQWAIEQTDVFGFDKSVLLILAYRDNHDEPHGCFPSHARMAVDCGISVPTVKRSLRKLEKLGKVRREYRKNPDGSQRSNYYSFPQVWEVGSNRPPAGSGRAKGRGPIDPHNQKYLTSNEPRAKNARRSAMEIEAFNPGPSYSR